jgi:hypothetical protein
LILILELNIIGISVNFEHRQAVVFKDKTDKTILVKAYVKSGFYEVDFATNKTLVILFPAIASDSELYTQRTLQEKAAYKKVS